MATTSRGRAQDRAKVAAGQDHEVRYEARIGYKARSQEIDGLLQFLGDILGNWVSGNPSKSMFMRWAERTVVSSVVMLVPFVLNRVYFD